MRDLHLNRRNVFLVSALESAHKKTANRCLEIEFENKTFEVF